MLHKPKRWRIIVESMKEDTSARFNKPTEHLAGHVQNKTWQHNNRIWWESNPMRYY